MSSRADSRRDYQVSEEIGRQILKRIGAMDPFAGADPKEVESRLRNMTYGATHSRITALREEESQERDWSAA